MKSLEKQIGGNHYKDMVIQPTEFITKNNLTFLEGCVIKRICRYKKKDKPLEDLNKIKHEVDMIIDFGGYNVINEIAKFDTGAKK